VVYVGLMACSCDDTLQTLHVGLPLSSRYLDHHHVVDVVVEYECMKNSSEEQSAAGKRRGRPRAVAPSLQLSLQQLLWLPDSCMRRLQVLDRLA